MHTDTDVVHCSVIAYAEDFKSYFMLLKIFVYKLYNISHAAYFINFNWHKVYATSSYFKTTRRFRPTFV